MSIDFELFEEFLRELADRYTASELVELLDLSVEDILYNDDFQEKLMELQRR